MFRDVNRRTPRWSSGVASGRPECYQPVMALETMEDGLPWPVSSWGHRKGLRENVILTDIKIGFMHVFVQHIFIEHHKVTVLEDKLVKCCNSPREWQEHYENKHQLKLMFKYG